MRRLIREHPTLAARSLPRVVGVTLVAGVLLFAPRAADAALTTAACLAQKRVAWGTLRKCQGTEEAKQLKGKLTDFAKCQTKLQTALAKITAKAAKAMIPCRYRDNGDLTVTDYDTGLQWEQKNSPEGIAFFPNPHDMDNVYTWSATGLLADGQIVTEFLSRLNGSAPALFGLDPCVSLDGTAVTGGFAEHCDWRLPTVVELQTILDATQGSCGGGNSACIDSIFGPTFANDYWSATTAQNPLDAWVVGFSTGIVFDGFRKSDSNYVRAVRAGL